MTKNQDLVNEIVTSLNIERDGTGGPLDSIIAVGSAAASGIGAGYEWLTSKPNKNKTPLPAVNKPQSLLGVSPSMNKPATPGIAPYSVSPSMNQPATPGIAPYGVSPSMNQPATPDLRPEYQDGLQNAYKAWYDYGYKTGYDYGYYQAGLQFANTVRR